MKTKIIIHENRVKIYFRQGEHFVRYNTKIPAYSKSEFFRSNPENLFNSINSTYIGYNKKIRELQEIIEELIEGNIGRFNVVINNKYIRNRLNNSHNSNYSKKYLVEYYKDFLTIKRSYFSEKNRSISSMKDYNSLLQALIDYQLLQNKLDPINCVTKSWVNEFLKFLSEKHPLKAHYKNLRDNVIEVIESLFAIEEEKNLKFRFKKEYVRIITKGELCDNTMNKRIDCLFQFFKYLESINILKLDFDASEFRAKYNRYEIEISTLTFEEIKMLKNFDIGFDNKDGRYNYVRDIFIFMCCTSFRYSDICTFSKNRDIDNNGKAIDKILQKTKKFKVRATIPLNETIENILKRYNYNLSRYSNALYNRYLTEFFQKGGFFQENFYPIKFIGGVQVDCKPIPRYKALTSHAGRRTCITNLINLGYHPLQIMPMTGHKSEKMLIKYYDKHRNKGAAATKMINDYDNAINSSKEIELNSKNNYINNAK